MLTGEGEESPIPADDIHLQLAVHMHFRAMDPSVPVRTFWGELPI